MVNRFKFTPLRPSHLHRAPVQRSSLASPGVADEQVQERQRQRSLYIENVTRKTREFHQRRRERWERERLRRRNLEEDQIDIESITDEDEVTSTTNSNTSSNTSSSSSEEHSGEFEFETETESLGSNDLQLDRRDIIQDELNSFDDEQVEQVEQENEEEESEIDVDGNDEDDEDGGLGTTDSSSSTELAEQPDDVSSSSHVSDAPVLNAGHHPPPNKMDDPEPDVLLQRFGSPNYYEDTFRNINHCNYSEIFRILEATKGNKFDDRYEAARQEFIRIYGKHKGRWFKTSHISDTGVEVTRVHFEGQEEYLAFMRIRPNGSRGERFVPAYMDMHFHLLMGKVLLTYRKRPRTLTRGSYFHAIPKSTLSLKCLSSDQDAIFVFKLTVDKNRQTDTPAF